MGHRLVLAARLGHLKKALCSKLPLHLLHSKIAEIPSRICSFHGAHSLELLLGSMGVWDSDVTAAAASGEPHTSNQGPIGPQSRSPDQIL